MIIYTIKPGDSVYSIARRYGLSEERIIAENELRNPAELVVGANAGFEPTDCGLHRSAGRHGI